MSKINITLLVLFGIIALGAIGAGFYYSLTRGQQEPVVEGRIDDFVVEKPNFVVRGAGLSKVEILAVPTGTNISVSDFSLIGAAVLASGNEANQKWTLIVPKNPLLVTEIFAKGYDMKGEPVVTRALKEKGATELYELLWGPRAESFDVKIGGTATYDNMTILLTGIKEDSRCPIDVTCIQAGRVVAEIEVTEGAEKKKGTVASDGNPYVFRKYYIEIENVLPAPKSDVQINKNDYIIKFQISTDAKG